MKKADARSRAGMKPRSVVGASDALAKRTPQNSRQRQQVAKTANRPRTRKLRSSKPRKSKSEEQKSTDGTHVINSEKYGKPLLPAGVGRAGSETERAPRLEIYLKAILKHVFRESAICGDWLANLRNVCCQLRQIPRSMVDHCPPQALVKRGARPNEPPAWGCV